MVLIRTIILKLILTLCLAFSLDVNSQGVRGGIGMSTMSTYQNGWVTENQQFYFFIESNQEFQNGFITCSNGRKYTKLFLHSVKFTNYYYVSNYITATKDINGKWSCSAYYKGVIGYYRRVLESPSINLMIDVRVDYHLPRNELPVEQSTDVDECNASPWPCRTNEICINTLGSYECTCPSGYEDVGIRCQDVNECLSHPCPDHADCYNEVPGFRCSCYPGFTGDADICSDVDECNASPWPCRTNEICTNTLGSYECTCPSGYEDDGTHCQPAGEGINLKLVVVVIIMVAVVVVAAVVWFMVGIYKRRQRREKAMQSEFNYESLENTTERPMATPAQWDNYSLPIDTQNENDTETYSVPYLERNVEEMYAKPQPKSQRKPSNESLYAEPSYAPVEQMGETPYYGNLSNQTAEYNQIQPKKSIGNPQVLPTESPYSEVLPKSLRPNKDSKYVNDFETQRYAKSDNGEASPDRSAYVEPAYCEIGYKI